MTLLDATTLSDAKLREQASELRLHGLLDRWAEVMGQPDQARWGSPSCWDGRPQSDTAAVWSCVCARRASGSSNRLPTSTGNGPRSVTAPPSKN